MVVETVTVIGALVTWSTVAVTEAWPAALPVMVTVAPLGLSVTVPVDGATAHETVFPDSALPLASRGVALIVTVSLGSISADDLLSDTLCTVGGGGGLVVPLSPPPPHAAIADSPAASATVVTRI
jgi:hypothetical protein